MIDFYTKAMAMDFKDLVDAVNNLTDGGDDLEKFSKEELAEVYEESMASHGGLNEGG